jgi:RND family efflux transporter MFP subunit
MPQDRDPSRVFLPHRPFWRSHWRLVMPLLVVMAGVAGACGRGQEAGAPAGGAPAGGAMQGVPVELAELAPKPVEDRGRFVGTVKSRRSSTIQPQAEGFITKILVKSGDRVQTGTPMFEIDASSQQAAVASLESIRAAREADAAYARQQAERAGRLLAAGAASQQELDQALTQQKTAEAQLKAATDQVRQQQAELAYYRVVAPNPGIVGDIPVHVGERVAKTTELTTVDDNAGLELYIEVPVQDAPKLKVGLPVRIVDDEGQPLAETRINFVASSVSDETQTVLVKTPLDAGRGFRSEQTVRAEIVFATSPGLTVPLVAVTRVNGQFFVFVAEPGQGGGTVAHQRAVQLGEVVGNEYIVKSGLKAGEKLIVGGIQKIGDGVPVMTLPSGPAPARGAAAAPAASEGGK